MPDSVSTYSESILMLDADTRLYPEKDGGRVFHTALRLRRHSRTRPDALEAFSADQLEQSPYRLLSACPVCFKTKSVSESEKASK